MAYPDTPGAQGDRIVLPTFGPDLDRNHLCGSDYQCPIHQALAYAARNLSDYLEKGAEVGMVDAHHRVPVCQ